MDLLAGVEAIISHLIVKEFRIPCAHAPALLPLPMSPSLSPRSAAEEVSKIFTLHDLFIDAKLVTESLTIVIFIINHDTREDFLRITKLKRN